MKPEETNNPKIQPWMNPDGTIKSDEELKKNSKNWTQKTWEAYLKTLEVKREESLQLADPELIDEMDLESISEFVFSLAEFEQHPRLKKVLNIALFRLKPIERQVIKKHYWETKKLAQIARELNRTRGGITLIKARALKKLRAAISAEAIRSVSKKVEFFENFELKQN